ncbi:MAG: hypothetical protein IKC63_01780 [Clostridia bacterium]|nr:hypothetical protein [Clostridia bacterium]
MKKIISALLVVVMLFTLVFTLTSCGNKPSGKYGGETVTVEFDGDKVSVTFKILVASTTTTGTFEMGENNEILVTYDDSEDAEKAPSGWTYDKENDAIKCKFLGIDITLEKIDE